MRFRISNFRPTYDLSYGYLGRLTPRLSIFLSNFLRIFRCFVGLFFCCSLLISNLVWAIERPSQSKTEKITLALNWKAEPQFGGFYQAQAEEIFKKNSLDVQIIEGGSGTPTAQLLAFKKVDAAIVSAEEIIISQSRNPENKIVALFAVFQKNPQVILSREGKNTPTNLQQLLRNPQGVLAWQSGLTYAQFLQQKYKPISVKQVPYAGGISQLLIDENHYQQGFYTSEPLLAEAAGVRTKSFFVADEGFNPYTTVLAVHQDLLKRPELLKKLVQSVQAGWISYLKNPGPAHQIILSLNKTMDEKTANKSAKMQAELIEVSARGTIGQMNQQRWQQLSEQLEKLKVIPKAIPEKELFTNDFF